MLSTSTTRDDPLAYLNPPPPPQTTITTTSSPMAAVESYLFDTPQMGSAASDGFLNGQELVIEDVGFSRNEFGKSPLVGSVKYYERHVFLCYKHPEVWPPRIEAAEFDRLPRLLSASLTARKPDVGKISSDFGVSNELVWPPRLEAAESYRLPRWLFSSLTARKADVGKITRLTICEGRDGTETSNGDVLIFPDMIRYRRLTHFDIDTFVEEVLVKNGEWVPGTPPEPLTGWYVFVCCHGTRDRRCGVCGPAVISRFREEIESRGLHRKVSVSACSHIGGHRYAGNVIIFGRNSKKEINGHWYGYVTPDDVPRLIEQHIVKREIVDCLWRGQMGLSEEEQIKTQEERLKVDEGINSKSSDNSAQCNEINTNTCISHESMQCCQTNGSYACCQDPLSPEASNSSEFNKPSPKLSAEKKSFLKQVRQNKNGKSGSSRRVYSIPTWYENWEREDTYATLAVIGAAISVAFAYGCYKQLR